MLIVFTSQNSGCPSRLAPTGCKSGQPCFYVPPQYIFNGETPKPGENYRVALARSVTNDIQFWFMNGPQIKGRNAVTDELGQIIQIGDPWHIVGAQGS